MIFCLRAVPAWLKPAGTWQPRRQTSPPFLGTMAARCRTALAEMSQGRNGRGGRDTYWNFLIIKRIFPT